jgi:alkyl hydroperoxide reductase subunit D
MNYIGLRSLVKHLPQYAGGVKENIKELFSAELDGLTLKQMYGIALTAGYYLNNEQMLNYIRSEAKIHLEEAEANAAKVAAIETCKSSTYYGFISMVADEEIRNTPTHMSHTLNLDPSILKVDYELYCLTISIFIECKYCIDYYIKSLTSKGISRIAIKNIAKIASVLRAAKVALEIENMRSYEFIARDTNI